jgi:DNA-binding LytR/AlgR family response regulator
MESLSDRIALHLSRDRRRVVDPADIYLLEAVGATTRVRLRGAGALRDVRRLAELLRLLPAPGFLRVHRNHAVNLRRIRELRRRRGSDDWELKLEPPLNRVLPVSRGELDGLLAALGDDH